MTDKIEQLRQLLTEMQDRATIHDEKGVKRLVRRALDKGGIFNFMPPSNAFGKSGISDILAVHNGRFVAIETKYGSNKPTEMQLQFGQNVVSAGAGFFVISEKVFVDRMTNVFYYLLEGE